MAKKIAQEILQFLNRDPFVPMSLESLKAEINDDDKFQTVLDNLIAQKLIELDKDSADLSKPITHYDKNAKSGISTSWNLDIKYTITHLGIDSLSGK